MSFAVNFFTFSKRDNSTKQPTGTGTELLCELLQPSSIYNPYLEISSAISNPSSLNYAYIATFNRYYWVQDWTYDKGFWICRLQVDVLASFKTEIGTASCYVLRAASASTPALPDAKYPMRNDCFMDSAAISAEFHNDAYQLDFRSGGGCFILGVVGGTNPRYAPNSAGHYFYALTATEMGWLLDFLFGDDITTASDIEVEVQKMIFNPFQYIVSCQWIPFDIASLSSCPSTEIYLGYWHDNQVVGNYIPPAMQTLVFTAGLSVPRHPQASDRGYYLNGRPYTELELDCYNFGSIPIDPTPFAAAPSMGLTIDVDVFTGTGFLTITSPTGKIVHRQAGQIGVPVQLSQITQNVLNTAVSTLETAVSAMIGNGVGAAHGIMSAMETLYPQVRTSGEIGSRACYMMMPRLTTKHHSIAEESRALLGRPVCSQLTINSLSGYIAVENGDIDSDASYNESNAIKSYLEGGFFYE